MGEDAMTETRKHARLSPSGADRWTVCPGSVQLEQAFPDDSSEHADWGTAAHAVAEMILQQWRYVEDPARATYPDAAAYKGRRIDVKAAKTIECDDEMVECVNTYVGNIDQRVKMYYEAGALSVDMHVEVQVPIDHITGEEGATGTADCVIVATFMDRTVVDVNDLKGGRGVKVDAVGNKQGLMYADGVLQKLGLRGTADEIVVCIHQPRLFETPSEWQLTMAEFHDEMWAIETAALRAIPFITDRPSDEELAKVGLAYDPNPRDGGYFLIEGTVDVSFDQAMEILGRKKAQLSDLAVSDKGCRFCKAKATCPAKEKLVTETVGMDFEDMTAAEPDLVIAELARAEPAVISAKMNALDMIESWCKAVRAEVERRLFDLQDVPGWKLVQGRKGSRAWADAEEAEKALKGYRLKVEQMYDLKLISPTTAEKLAKAGAIGVRQWPKLQGLITQSEGSPSVAPASDKRPALVLVKPSADDFESLVDEGEGLV
jgi:hypothetical protein